MIYHDINHWFKIIRSCKLDWTLASFYSGRFMFPFHQQLKIAECQITWHDVIFQDNLYSGKQVMDIRHTENMEGASSIWKDSPFTSSWPWMFGKLSPLDMQIWIWQQKRKTKIISCQLNCINCIIRKIIQKLENIDITQNFTGYYKCPTWMTGRHNL